MRFPEKVARAALEIQAVKLNPDDPFTWASGFRMPIYNDNGRFLFSAQTRSLVVNGFYQMTFDILYPPSVIAGTSTAGIPWGTLLAEDLHSPFVYVRDKPKDHGLKNQIEGIDSESDLEGHSVLLIEDLISTGGSSARAVQAIREAKGECYECFSIFNYGFDDAAHMFAGEKPYDNSGKVLNPECSVSSLLTYDTLLRVAKDTGYIGSNQVKMLEEWREDPFGWGAKHGFPKADKQ